MATDRRRLEALLTLARTLEKATFPLSANDLQKIAEQLSSFQAHEQIEVRKLSDLRQHLKPGIDQRTFSGLVVPIERALQKNIRDDDFLIRETDRSSTDSSPSSSSKVQALPLCLILDHLRSAFNVGSILRTAEGLGLQKIYLTGYTPTPEEEKTARSALGAENFIPWEAATSLENLISDLKKQGWHIVGLETCDKAKPLENPFPKKPTAFLLGNERFGLENHQLALCDEIRELSLQGQKNSLNVAVMAGLAAYEWRRQWQIS